MRRTERSELDRSVEVLRTRKDGWARLSVPRRIALARDCARETLAVSPEIVAAACAAKGLDPASPVSGEEWLAGPVAILRNIRLLVDTLSAIERGGSPDLPPGSVRRLPDGRLAVNIFPRGLFDRGMFPGTTIDVWMQPGVTESNLRETMGGAYRRAAGGAVALVLGAGNVASIGPMDVLHKLFVENHVVVLKMHPVNDYLGPLIERAFRPLAGEGYLRVVYGDVEEGQYLVHHPGIDEIHMTGSAAVHDRIVWGETEDEQARRRAGYDPKVSKRVTSELGCVTPVVVVPGEWSGGELDYQAENVATMVANNASCNCNAAKLLVTWRGWPQRGVFLDRVSAALSGLPARRGYYPGSAKRHATFTSHPRARTLAGAAPDALPYATIYDVDPARAGDIVFQQEAWCPVVAETALDASDDAAFAEAAAPFCNDRVAGTLSAVVLASAPSQARLGDAFERMIAGLAYGTIAVNHWAAASYVLAVAPWGAYPGHTLQDVGSGIGFVHNTLMFDRPQKSVLRGPFVQSPKPAWFSTHRRGHVVARRMAAFEASPSVWRLPGLAIAAARP